jgi:putative sporulation protein YyaC
METPSQYYSIESMAPNASYLLYNEIITLYRTLHKINSNIVILCIGTDRSTGDCLGPLVGYKLKNNYTLNNVTVFGTLFEPVHAKNLNLIIDRINSTFQNSLIIAVDASLGKSENIGKINLYNGPLYPGAGVSKNLPAVGDISITGIVNISGYMEYMVLQNTRLSIVMQMADIISMSIFMTVHALENNLHNAAYR